MQQGVPDLQEFQYELYLVTPEDPSSFKWRCARVLERFIC